MKLVWKRVTELGQNFDLMLENPKDVNDKMIRQLLESVEAYDPGVKQNFDAKASKSFRDWLSSPSQPLKEHAYASVSNWFLSEGPRYRNKMRGSRAESLWGALFCAKPSKRLTNPGSKKIKPECFPPWWSRQEKCQQQ
jgi:hypothetical protein